jgi:hypothetical protein
VQVLLKKSLSVFRKWMFPQGIRLPGQIGGAQEDQVVGTPFQFFLHPGIYFPKAVLGPNLNYAQVGIAK